MTLAPARLDPKAANALYHDAAARAYDGKWAISFDDRCLRYVRERAERMLPGRSYGRVLEIGAGTGFFMLNLWRAGLVAEAHAIDISTGMLAVCAENARTIGCDVRLRVADAERLPFDNGVFDLVVGHAILHHLPSPGAAIEEAYRVLVPGGDLLIAGEPTRRGDRRAKRVGRTVGATVRGAARAVPALRSPARAGADSEQERILRELEWDVDLHTFDPDAVGTMFTLAGFRGVRVETEELISSIWGWAVRTFEAEMPPGRLGPRWAGFAYRSWRSLYAIDRRLYGVVPRDRFYNVLAYGHKHG